jgi:PST family polysaccharide transporter
LPEVEVERGGSSPEPAAAAAAAAAAAEKRRTVSNLLAKTISLPLEKGCRLALMVLAVRLLGAAGFGRFQFALTATTVLALGTDLGLGIWTTRALARSRARAAAVVGTTLGLRSLGAVAYVLATAAAAWAVGPGETRGALLLLGVAALASAYADHFAAVLRGYEQLDDEAWLNVGRAALGAGGGLVGFAAGRSLLALAAGVAAGTVAGCAYGAWMLRHRYRLLPAPFDRALARQAAREALPLGIASLLSLLYFKGDVLLLWLLTSDAELGAYGAAYKFFEGSMILPSILLAAAFPPLARAHGDRQRQDRWERAILGPLLGMGTLVGAVLYFARGPLVAVAFGPALGRATASLRVLALGVPLLFVNFGLTHFLIARDLGRRNLLFGLLMLFVNVGLNLIAIPRLAGPGAAWATTLTELFLTICCLGALGWQPLLSIRRRPGPATASRAQTSG